MSGSKDLGPHFTRSDKGYRCAPNAVVPVYDSRHSLHKSADPARYSPDNPRIMELADSIADTGFLIQPGVARKNGTWATCPVCGSKDECPIVEVIAGNRRHRALSLENERREAPLEPIEYVFTLRAVGDRDALKIMLGENNAREGNSLLASIRQGVLLAQTDASPQQIERCFPGRSSKAVPIVRVMAECEEPIWTAFAEGQISLKQAKDLAKHSRQAQPDALAQLLAQPKPESPPRAAHLTAEDRAALGRLLAALARPCPHVSVAQLDALQKAAGLSEEQLDALRGKLPVGAVAAEPAPAKEPKGKRGRGAKANGVAEARP